MVFSVATIRSLSDAEVPELIETSDTEVETQAAAPARARRGWAAVILVAAILTVLVVAAIHILVQEPIPPLLVFGVLAIVIAVLALRGPPRVAGIVGALFGVFLLVSNLQGTLTGLRLIRDPFEFTINWGGLVASVLFLIGGIALAVKGRGAGGRAARLVTLIGALAVPLGLALSVVLRLTMPAVEAQPGDVAVTIAEFAFPDRTEAAAGSVAFVVRNDDPIAHTFTVEGLGIDAAVPGGSTIRVAADAEPGEYPFVCRVAGHEFMEGTLVVQ
jgi:plastocyanin